MWKTEYDEYAGYDMMSGGYKIIDPQDALVCVVDTADHRVDPGNRLLSEEEAQGRAKGYADLIIRALNRWEFGE